jgi:hypothetical protein
MMRLSETRATLMLPRFVHVEVTGIYHGNAVTLPRKDGFRLNLASIMHVPMRVYTWIEVLLNEDAGLVWVVGFTRPEALPGD